MRSFSPISLLILLIAAGLGIWVFASGQEPLGDASSTAPGVEVTTTGTVEEFRFLSGGEEMEGKIHLPASYESGAEVPVIFLIDFTDQHFSLVTDEFETLIMKTGESRADGALVVTLKEQQDVDATPGHAPQYFAVFRDLARHVDEHYGPSPSRTFVGRGSEGGLVLLAMLAEESVDPVFDNYLATDSPASFNEQIIAALTEIDPTASRKTTRLHFSFSSSNNRGSCLGLIEAFEGSDIPWLAFSSVEYPDDVYPEVYPKAFATGLSAIFE